MNVLLVTSKFPPEHSGSGGRLKRIYARLMREHPEVRCRVLTRAWGDAPAEENSDGFEIRRLELAGRSHVGGPLLFKAANQVAAFVSDMRTTSRHLASLDPATVDLVHTGGWSWLVFAACRWARAHGVPLVRELTSAADRPRSRGLSRALIRRTLDWSSLVIAISPSLAEACAEAGFGAKTWCRPNPVDADEFHPVSREKKEELRAALFDGSVPTRAKLILYVGHICPWKNQRFLVGVLEKLPADHHLALVGPADAPDMAYLDSIFSEASHRGVTGRMHVVASAVDNVADFMRAADAFAFPSLAEGLGNVMLESLMCGVPVAAHRLEGVTTWVVRESENGALCALDANAFAAAVSRALELAGRSLEIAENAAARFSAAVIDAKYWERLQGLAGTGRRP